MSEIPLYTFLSFVLMLTLAQIFDHRRRYGSAEGYADDVRRQLITLLENAGMVCLPVLPQTGEILSTGTGRRRGLFEFLNGIRDLKQADAFIRDVDNRTGVLLRLSEAARRERCAPTVQVHVGKTTENGTAEVSALLTGSHDGAVLLVFRDITDQVRSEEDLRRARDAAEAGNIAKGNFLANMSHELKTPLNIIIGFSEIMRAEMFGPINNPKYAEYVQAMHRSGVHLLELISDILDMSRIEAGRYELNLSDYRPDALANECLMLIEPLAERKGTVLRSAVDASAADLEGVGDRRALKQIFINLLNNAVKYCPDGSLIELRISYDARRGLLHYAVADNGPGMPRDVITALGTPFVSAKRTADVADAMREGSTGLGLSIVKSLTELHGGGLHITVDEHGTTAHVIVPLKVQEESADADAA